MNKLHPLADFVLALSHDGEACGPIPFEARDYGLPVVETRAGANPELIVDSETGFLVEPGEAYATVKSMSRLQNVYLRQKMGNAMRELVRNFFELDDGHRQLRDALSSLL